MGTVVKIVLGILGALFIVGAAFIVLVALVFNSAADDINKSIAEEEANDKPTLVGVGEVFTHDGFDVAKGWKVSVDEYGYGIIENLVVTNTKKQTESPMFTFTFVKGDEKLNEIECSTGELEPGQKASAECFSADSEFQKGYTEVRVADMW